MLFLLTGKVQSGKTRWLEGMLAQLAADGVEACGVVAPGVWRESNDAQEKDWSACADAPECGSKSELPACDYEKLGIDNVLLPVGERIAFARRRDLAQRDGSFGPEIQSAAARLAWAISDEAIARVNAHFDTLQRDNFFVSEKGTNVSRETLQSGTQPALLVVDELGRLELEYERGLTSALGMLDQGATLRFPHALVVVRSWLLDRAEERFAVAWGGACVIQPGDDASDIVRVAFGLAPFIDKKYH